VIRVLVGVRSGLGRADLEGTVRSSASLEFAGTVDISHLADHTPPEISGDVMLVDLAGPSDSDWAALASLPVPVILLVDSTEPSEIAAALRSGVRGAIPWDATPQEIDGAVHAVAAGLAVIAPAALSDLLPEAQAFHDVPAEALSKREMEVLDLVAEGLSNKLIAHQLNISEHTVKTHVASIFGKLGASSRTEAVSQAVRRGLLML